MKTKKEDELKEMKEFLKKRIIDFIGYADKAYFEEKNNDMYKHYLSRAKESIDNIDEINKKLRK